MSSQTPTPALICHKPTGLFVDPVQGRIYYEDGGDIAYSLTNGHPRAVVHKRDAAWEPCARIVWECVHGPVPDGKTVRNTGNPMDYRIGNLELVEVSA